MYSVVRFDTSFKGRRLSDAGDWSACEVVARLRDHVSDAAARSEVLARLQGAGLAPPRSRGGQPELHIVSLAAGMDDLRLETRGTLPLLMVATLLILLVACANVAALLLARAPTRMNEVATRLALGASRARVVRQLATEGVFVALAGGALGLLVAFYLNRAIPGLLGSFLGGGAEIGRVAATLDARVMAFTALVAMATGMVCSIAPALSVTRSAADPATVRRRSQIRLFPRVSPITALVAVQPMAAVILLVVAGLSLRTVNNLRTVTMEPGSDQLLHFTADLRLSGYGAEDTRRFIGQVLARVRDVPGVTAVSASEGAGQCAGASGQGGSMRILAVTPDYFRIAALPSTVGRTVDRTDEVAGAPPVAVVSSAIAVRLNSQGTIGELLAMCGSTTPTHRVIGVIGERATEAGGRRRPLDRVPRQPLPPYVYVPLLHPSTAVTGAYIAFSVRTAGAAAQVVPDVQQVVSDIAPDVAVFEVETGTARYARLMGPERALTTLLIVFSGASVFLACLGMYGVVAYAVRRRTREMAIRAAAGGAPFEIVALVVRQAFAPALVGILAGSVVTVLVVGPAVRDFLYGVSAQDPLVLTVAVGSLAGTSLLAALVPGLRAARLNLSAVLHAE
jgi:predicted permease